MNIQVIDLKCFNLQYIKLIWIIIDTVFTHSRGKCYTKFLHNNLKQEYTFAKQKHLMHHFF